MKKGELKKQKRLERQLELLKMFEGDFYQEKQVGNEWYIKSFNGGTGRWQVSIYSGVAYRRYKSFDRAKQDGEELDEQFEQKTLWKAPTLEDVKEIVEKQNDLSLL